MKSMEKSPDDTVNLKLHPSLISKARVAFDNRKTYLNYFRKLAQEQGIGFLIGIAFGVNLILLLQMSEDIISNLSETLANSIIGIIAILSTIIVGVIIVYMQKKTYGRIRTLIERQHKAVEDEVG